MASSSLLSEDDVLQFMRDVVGITYSKESLVKPSAGTVCPLYQLILTEMGVTSIETADLEASAGIPLDQFQDWIPRVNLLHVVRHIVELSGINLDVTMLDLVQPKRQRNMRIISCLIAAWTQVTEVKEQFLQEMPNFELRVKEKNDLVQKLNTLKATYEKKMGSISKIRSKKPGVEAKFVELSSEYEKKNKYTAQVNERYASEKKELVSKKEELSDIEVKLGSVREELCQLETQVVRSPEKVKGETVAKERLLEEKMREKRRLLQDYNESTKHLDNIHKTIDDLVPLMETIKETVSEDLESLKEKGSSLDSVREQIQKKELKEREKKLVIHSNKERVTMLEKELRSVISQQKKRMASVELLLKDVNQEIEKRQDSNESGPSKQLLLKERTLQQEIEETKQARTRFESSLDRARNAINKPLNDVANMLSKTTDVILKQNK